MLNSNTLTPLLKRLEKLGFVRRTRSTADERVVEVTLTEAGVALKQRCICIPERLSKAVSYPESDANLLRKQLDQLILSLGAAPQGDSDLDP